MTQCSRRVFSSVAKDAIAVLDGHQCNGKDTTGEGYGHHHASR